MINKEHVRRRKRNGKRDIKKERERHRGRARARTRERERHSEGKR